MNLSKQFKEHTISRKYKAIVWGVPNNQKIEGYIERHKINRKKMSLNKNGKGKFSKTKLKLIQSFKIASLIECKLETGRTHQIRVHMTSINSSIVGDKIYCKNNKNKFSKDPETYNKFLILQNFKRQALHAYHLGFIHPKTGKYIEFNEDLPNDINNLLKLIANINFFYIYVISEFMNLPVLSSEGGLALYLQEIKRFPILTAEEEYMLAKRFKEHGDNKAAHKLVTSHLRLVAKIAMGYRGYGLPVTDLNPKEM